MFHKKHVPVRILVLANNKRTFEKNSPSSTGRYNFVVDECHGTTLRHTFCDKILVPEHSFGGAIEVQVSTLSRSELHCGVHTDESSSNADVRDIAMSLTAGEGAGKTPDAKFSESFHQSSLKMFVVWWKGNLFCFWRGFAGMAACVTDPLDNTLILLTVALLPGQSAR